MKSLTTLAPWLAFAALGGSVGVAAFGAPGRPMTGSRSSTALSSTSNMEGSSVDFSQGQGRRAFLSRTLSTLPLAIVPTSAHAASVPVQRAVGSAESKCREEGNCLETFELDGAVGWNWGGTDRCDASDPLCGPDGRLREEALSGQPVPAKDPALEITDVVELTLTIGTGSNADVQTLRMGLYGNACPELVKEMADLCGRAGLVTSKDLLLGSPVRLGGGGGSLTYVRPEERLEFGVSSQKAAYAKSLRKARAPDEFVPQPRPSGQRLESARGERSARSHDVAGLISLPKEGIGYGSAFLGVKDDEAYSSAFQITATSVPDMDKEGRKVIGQLIDSQSMDLLARLAGSPTRKMLPGQNGGTPLIKVSVDDSAIFSVAKES